MRWSRRRLVPVLVGSAVVAGSLAPLGGDGAGTLAGMDVVLHAAGYAALAASVARAREGADRRVVTAAVAVLVAVAVGVSVELAQGPLPTRHSSAVDAAANAAGALAGAGAWWLRSLRRAE